MINIDSSLNLLQQRLLIVDIFVIFIRIQNKFKKNPEIYGKNKEMRRRIF